MTAGTRPNRPGPARGVPALLLAAALLPACSSARATPAPAPTPAAQEARAPADPWAQAINGAEHLPGYFDLYLKGDGRLYMAVPAERLGEQFLFEAKVARGIGASGIFGGTMLGGNQGAVLSIERQGETLYLMEHPIHFRADEGTPQAAAVALTFSPSVVETAKIEGTREGGLHLIEVTNWFVSDLSGIGQRLRSLTATGQGPGPVPTFDRGRSFLSSVKAFPHNLNIQSTLTFRPSQPTSTFSVPDGRYITVTIHHSIVELPDRPMEPRLADERVGYFLTAHKDFTRDEDEHFVRYVNRWRMERGEPAGDGLYYPVKPIVYYLDHTIPEAYRPYFIDGVNEWQRAFEEAGFKDAIRAEMLPEGADAADIRYPTLRWNTSNQPGYSAIGPSVVDPRTGEILDADQLYEASMILGFRRGWQNLVEPQEALEAALGISAAGDEAAIEALETHQNLAGILSDQGTFLKAFLADRGELDADGEVPMEYLGQAIKWVVMHEVGHTLGLRHNFRSSADTPLDRLHDRGWARERGLVSSVMDYHAPNVARTGEPQGYFYSPSVGTADRWKIAYGYTAEAAQAEELARLAEVDGRTYGDDGDSGGQSAMDPTVNTYDLSADPIAWGRERTALIAELWPRLPEVVLSDNTRYADLTSAFQALLGQYSQALAPSVKYIGGEYVYRTRPGDPGDQGPFVPVGIERQRDALSLLTERAFSARTFDLPPEMIASFGAQRWSHWGFTNTYQGRIDFPFHERITGLQASLMGQLLNPLRLARIRDGELRYGSDGVLGIPELMTALTRASWEEVWSGGGRNVGSLRRDLQRAHLDEMTRIVVEPAERTPADARAVARRTLRDLDSRIARALGGSGLDAYTRAHLEESRAWIGKALEAGVQAER
jgi:hypothetical protein